MLTTKFDTYITKQTKFSQGKAAKIFGYDNIQTYVADTIVAKTKADAAWSTKVKIANVAAGVLHLVQLGFEIYLFITRIMACDEVRDNLRDAYNQIQPQEAEMDQLLLDVTEHSENVTEVSYFFFIIFHRQ